MKTLYLSIISFVIAFLLSCSDNDVYISASNLKPIADTYPDVSKMQWKISENTTINYKGQDIRTGGLVFPNDTFPNMWIVSIDKIDGPNYNIYAVGYEDDDSSVTGYYSREKEEFKLIVFSAGGDFISNGKYLFIASPFYYQLIDCIDGKTIWKNKDIIGTDYHYQNKIKYIGSNIAQIKYEHIVNRQNVSASLNINIMSGQIEK